MDYYEGDQPYIFISYSHEDKEAVQKIIAEIKNRGYRIWYDDGIHATEEWPEDVAKHLIRASTVMFFISENFLKSKNCRREVNFAIDKEKDYICIMLDNAKLSDGMQMQLGTNQNIIYNKNISIEAFLDKLLDNRVMNKKECFMSDEEFEESYKTKIPLNGMINQMIIAIGIVKYKGHILMVKRAKQEGKLLWGFPTTMIKPGEDIKKRIIKETFDETNIKTKFIKSLGTRIHPNSKAITNYCALEFINGEVENKDEYENSEAKWVPINKYKELITSDIYIGVSKYLEENKMIEVVMCVVCFDGKILLVHRKEKESKISWAFPGGTVKAGETPFETAKRELVEETNIKGEPLEIIGDRIHPYSKKHMAYVALKPLNFELKLGDDDLDDLRWVDINEIEEYFGSPIYENVSKYLKLIN